MGGLEMLGESTISDKTRDKVRELCAKAGVPDKVPELESEEAAQAYIEHLQHQLQQPGPEKL
jgi:hypothetical protein